jgi:hypothetical protein
MKTLMVNVDLDDDLAESLVNKLIDDCGNWAGGHRGIRVDTNVSGAYVVVRVSEENE